MARISFAEFSSNMMEYLDSIEATGEEIVVTRRGRESLVILARSHLEGLRGTLYLLSSPANAAHLHDAIDELDHGRGTERTPIE